MGASYRNFGVFVEPEVEEDGKRKKKMESRRRWEFILKKEVGEEIWLHALSGTSSMALIIPTQDQFLRIPLRLTAAGLLDEFRMFFPPFSFLFRIFLCLFSPL